jgi:DNA repair exonuclease SbcCD ATPase subunit
VITREDDLNELERLASEVAKLREDLATMQERWLGASDIASQQRARAEQAESERDTARANERAYDDLVGDLDPPDILVHWKADRASLLALQAKVARLLELYAVWLTARGASYQLAEDDFYQAVEALR